MAAGIAGIIKQIQRHRVLFTNMNTFLESVFWPMLTDQIHLSDHLSYNER